MGIYVNPGNDAFAEIVSDEYVDKTGLIALFSDTLNTPRKLVCVTRPRRFGKSFAAASLVAYFSRGCDSRALFEGLEISQSPDIARHLNAYNLVHLDMTGFRQYEDVTATVAERLLDDLRSEFSDVSMRTGAIELALNDIVDATARKFVFVIDEWDAPLRERRSKKVQEDWIYFLRLLFKNATFTPKAIAGCYMTGILPIVRYGTQSALSDFREFTMLAPDSYAPYVGFTETEVIELAAVHGMDVAELKRWYDGYELPYVNPRDGRRQILRSYAPYSLTESCQRHTVGSYWVNSETYESLRLYIDMDFDGLQETIVQVLGGARVPLRTGTFENDMHKVAGRDDVLTLLCHLGYLVYDSSTATAHVPNEEIRSELRDTIGESRHANIARIVKESDALLRATWDLDETVVADGIARAHDNGCAPLFYNDEQALRAVVKSAYISAVDHYAVIEELPSGRGIADVVFLPKYGIPAPALLVELKWDRSPEWAIRQILERDYASRLRDWDGPILLVGITYQKDSKRHRCQIEWA